MGSRASRARGSHTAEGGAHGPCSGPPHVRRSRAPIVLPPIYPVNAIATTFLTCGVGSADVCAMRTATIRAVQLVCVFAAVLMLPVGASAQRGRGQGRGADAKPPEPTGELVRVKTGHANVHTGPTSGNEVLVLAAKGTVLPVLARRGEWIQVSLSPELRKSGMVMRWYKNENNGWIHDSMVEAIKAAKEKIDAAGRTS